MNTARIVRVALATASILILASCSQGTSPDAATPSTPSTSAGGQTVTGTITVADSSDWAT